MAKSKVKGKSAAGYDSFDFEKDITSNLAVLQHGEEKEGFKAIDCIALHPGIVSVAKAIKENKEKGKPLPANLTIIKAHTTKQVER